MQHVMLYKKPLNTIVELYIEIQRWKAVLNIVSGVNYHFVICVTICNVYYNPHDCIYIA